MSLFKSQGALQNSVWCLQQIAGLKSMVKKDGLLIRELNTQLLILQDKLATETHKVKRAHSKLLQLKKIMKKYKDNRGREKPDNQIQAVQTPREATKALWSHVTCLGEGHSRDLEPSTEKACLLPGSDGHVTAEMKVILHPPVFEVGQKLPQCCSPAINELNQKLPQWCSPAKNGYSLLKHGPSDGTQQTATDVPAFISSVSSGAAQDSDLSNCFRSGFVSAFNTSQQTGRQRPSINVWSRCRFHPTVTACHHNMIAFCVRPVSSHGESLPQTNLPQRQLETCFPSEALSRGSQSTEYNPVCETTRPLSPEPDCGCSSALGCGCSPAPGCGCSSAPGCGCSPAPGCGCSPAPGCGCSPAPGCGCSPALGCGCSPVLGCVCSPAPGCGCSPALNCGCSLRQHQAKKLPCPVATNWLEDTTLCCPSQKCTWCSRFFSLSRNNSRSKSRESYDSHCLHISPLLSRNNSRNKSRESSDSHCLHISPPLSPSMLPLPAVAKSRSGREDCHGKSKRCSKSYIRSLSPSQQCTKSYVRSPSPCQQWTKSSIRSPNPTQRCAKSGVARSAQTYHASGLPYQDHAVWDWDDSHLYWPCKPVEQTESYLRACALNNLSNCAVVGKTDSCTAPAKSKAKVRLSPSHVSPTSNQVRQYKDNRLAFASGATVCPKRNRTGEGSNKGCKKKLEAADEEKLNRNHLLGIFTTQQHLTHPGKATSTNLHNISAISLSKRCVLYDSVYCHFQSCFLNHLAKEDSDNLQHNQQQSLDGTRPEGHVHRPQPDSAQKLGQTPPQTQTVYRYHRMPLSLPPTELPYPPLSPFHHDTSTQLKKTNGLILSETCIDHHSGDILLEAALQGPLPRSTYHDAYCPLGECVLGLAEIIKPGDEFIVRSFLENSTPRENPSSMVNLQTRSLRHVLNKSALLACEALTDKRQIEASSACHFSTQE